MIHIVNEISCGCREQRSRTAHANPSCWSVRVKRNQERDADTDWHLREAGWLRRPPWQHADPDHSDPDVVATVRHRKTAHRL